MFSMHISPPTAPRSSAAGTAAPQLRPSQAADTAAPLALGLAALMLIGLSAGCQTGSTPPGQAPAAVRMIPGIGQWAEKEALRRAAESDPFPTASQAGF